MAGLTTDILFRWKGDSSDIKKSADEAGGAVGGVGAKLTEVGGKMVGVGKKMSLATLPIVGAFTVGAKSLMENEALLAQTEAVIESMGGAAGKTADEVFDLANEVSGYSGMAHESVVEGQNLLMTFGNIKNAAGEGNDVFDQSTKLLADMSVALGTDMSQGALQLGKALNDPIKGVSALARTGVSFTEAQKEQIRVMVESGDVMGAQKLILSELENQFGGSAKAAGETMTGQLNILKNSFEQGARTIASLLIPALSTLGGWLQSALDWFNNLSPGMQDFISKALAIAAAIGPVLIIGGKLIGSFQKIGLAFTKLSTLFAANPWLLLIAAVVALVVIIVKNWDKIKDFLGKTWEWIKSTAETIWNAIQDFFKAALDAIVGFFMNWTLPGLIIQHWDEIKAGFQAAWDFIKGLFQAAIDWIKDVFMNWTLPGLIIKHWDEIKAGFEAAWEFIKTTVKNAIQWVKDTVSSIINATKNVINSVLGTIKGIFTSIWDGIKSVVSGAMGWVRDVVSRFLGMIQTAISTFKTRVSTLWAGVWNYIKEFPMNVVRGLQNIGSMFWSIGKAIIDGIIKGLGNIVSTIYNKLKAGITSAINKVKSFFGIRSPSKLLALEVGMPFMEGIVKGVEDARSQAERDITKTIGALQKRVALNPPAIGLRTGLAAAGGGQPVTINVTVLGTVTSEQDLANALADRLAIINRHRP